MSDNAIMDWANQGRVDTESWGRYLTQHYAKAPAAEHAESCAGSRLTSERWAPWAAHREMTAADLGLPLRQYSVQWLNDNYTFAVLPDTHKAIRPDAPYSFWLGAQG